MRTRKSRCLGSSEPWLTKRLLWSSADIEKDETHTTTPCAPTTKFRRETLQGAAPPAPSVSPEEITQMSLMLIPLNHGLSRKPGVWVRMVHHLGVPDEWDGMTVYVRESSSASLFSPCHPCRQNHKSHVAGISWKVPRFAFTLRAFCADSLDPMAIRLGPAMLQELFRCKLSVTGTVETA